MAQKMKWSNYFKPTPKRVRVLGDSLAGSAVFIATISMVSGYEKIAIAVAIIGMVGKFLSNFFTDENTSNNSGNNSSKL